LKEKQEQILPPPLEENLALDMFSKLSYFIGKTHVHLNAEIQTEAQKCLFQLSASNYENIIGNLTQCFTANLPEEESCQQLALIEHLNLNSKHLAGLLDKVNRNIASFKKTGVQFALAKALRKAIWNWIDNYPMEFVALCQTGERMKGNIVGAILKRNNFLINYFDNIRKSQRFV
jgi:neurofibromin 1